MGSGGGNIKMWPLTLKCASKKRDRYTKTITGHHCGIGSKLKKSIDAGTSEELLRGMVTLAKLKELPYLEVSRELNLSALSYNVISTMWGSRAAEKKAHKWEVMRFI